MESEYRLSESARKTTDFAEIKSLINMHDLTMDGQRKLISSFLKERLINKII